MNKFALLVYLFQICFSVLPLSQTQSIYSWTVANSVGISARSNAAVQSNGRQIAIVTGGKLTSSGSATNDVFVSNDAKTWLAQSKGSGSSYFTARYLHGLTYCQDTLLPSTSSAYYIYGGISASNTNLGDFWKCNV